MEIGGLRVEHFSIHPPKNKKKILLYTIQEET